MKILFCSAEVAPFAKVGGLADVAGSLPKALSALGHEVIVAMPAYGMVVNDPRWGFQKTKSEVLVKVNSSRLVRAELWEAEFDGIKFWLVDGEETFAKVTKSQEVYAPLRDDYLFFSHAILEMCTEREWLPDVVSAHDWHMGFLPVIIKETRRGDWDSVASTFTIHNLAYQGEFGYDTLAAAGVPGSLFTWDALETYGGVNFLKSGCVFADQVNTVSPNYSKEIQRPEYGCRLEGLMAWLAAEGRLEGILNGIDVDVFDPSADPAIAAKYSVDDLSGKLECRRALCTKAGLSVADDKPVMGVVSRLSNQKGFDLIIEAAPEFLARGAALIVLGTGDPWAASELRKLEASNPGLVKFFEAFDVDMAQRIYSGSDVFLMPSSFEPCGLGQMFAMRYGTVPVVRKTGGLADTVFEGENGFVFEERSVAALSSAIARAIEAFAEPTTWSKFVHAGMTQDFGWTKSAQAYLKMYRRAMDARRLKDMAS
ncbi:MAG: glycogen synthase [Armatimonadetes bacterium]|nr:glycogen synthase [Armatimonadota bacterium]